jgi:catalase (peroxidase I)
MRLLLFATLIFAQEPEPVGQPDAPIQGTAIATLDVLKSAVNQFQFIFQSALQCIEGGKSENFPQSQNNKNIAALWIRAVFHDGGTWSPGTDNPAGLDSSILSFLKEPDNAGLDASMAPNTLKHSPIAKSITNSDKIALAAQVAVSVCGGPRFGFKSGRRDARNATSPHGLIPPGNSTLVQALPHFKRMGWNNEDIVALVTGSHTMGYLIINQGV